MCVNLILTVSPQRIVLGGGVMQQAHLFPKIRAKVLDLLGGYVSSPSITPEGIDSYIVLPALGVNSGVIGALLLGESVWRLQYLAAFLLIAGGICLVNNVSLSGKERNT